MINLQMLLGELPTCKQLARAGDPEPLIRLVGLLIEAYESRLGSPYVEVPPPGAQAPITWEQRERGFGIPEVPK